MRKHQVRNIVKNSLIGLGLGTLAGTIRAGVTLTCPVLWIPGNAVAGGIVAYNQSGQDERWAVAGALAGAAVGAAELVAYPVTAPFNLTVAALCPIVGAGIGAAVGVKGDIF